ncbi:hypothetical protein FSP39_006590 [Pinctada imbricata]|uniref:mRNA cap guanine-N(7) methyltransferase n=1 Tax=Pinctada imbricata TaxID=66713 RepID=A0AA89BNS9_PINIB|nr:hypothetical protein FSP39_006590 [Pinctada imbricata]
MAEDLTGTVAKHYNELQETGLDTRSQSRIFYLRNFNNWIKSVLIGDTLQQIRENKGENQGISVLDLCSGKGGDLLKWKKGKISKVVCADIAGTSVEQCESRYNEILERNKRERYFTEMFTAEFITADCTKTRLRAMYKDPSMKFDLASCQFSFHYCFESFPQAQTMLQNACECLELGGYFIGTTPNSYEIMKRLRESPDKKCGNEVYSISYDGEDFNKPGLFGAKYNFHLEGVVDCPEFLVYFPLLEKMAEEYGMKLISRTPFAQYFKENVDKGENRSLLGKMQALEPYPADRDAKLVSDLDSDYAATSEVVKNMHANDDRPEEEKRRRPQRVGTLSKAEWEAGTIYLVFVFQKVLDKQTGKKWQTKKKEEEEECHVNLKRPSEESIPQSAEKLPKVT